MTGGPGSQREPVPAYLLCATPRSGSTLLCDLLAGTGVSGTPDAFYRWQSIPDFIAEMGVDIASPHKGPDFEREYLPHVLKRGRGETNQFGMRVMWPTLPELDERMASIFPEAETTAERFAAAFGDFRVIFLTRGDKLAQAISRARAEQSGLWHRSADGSERERVAPHRDPVFDADQIAGFIAEAEHGEALWLDWFAREAITPLTVTYKALAADPRAVLAEILGFLGHAPDLAARAEVRTKKLADTQSEDWAKRYRAERGAPAAN